MVAYAPLNDEVDPGAVVHAARGWGATVYFPRGAADGLDFLAADQNELRPGRWGVPEPPPTALALAAAEEAVFLVPGLAFDVRGTRLGRGGGAYDRALARFSHALRIGVTRERRLVPQLPEERHDVPMHVVVTEGRLLLSGRRGNAPSPVKERRS